MSGAPTIVYTDGACEGNPGPGGWAWAVPGGPFRSGAEAASTNQRMEIKAALEAVTTLDGPLDVVSDSTYVVNCFRDRWWERWQSNAWRNSQKKPVANRDLWEPLIDAYRQDPTRVRFRWVKGHSGDVMNDLVDRLAVEAAATQQARLGTGTPTDLGPADEPTKPRKAGARSSPVSPAPTPASTAATSVVPPGHRVVVAGLKPPGLGGYGETPLSATVRAKLTEILAAKAQLEADLVVLSGLSLGAVQLGAEAAAAAGVPYVAVLAFPGVESVWSADARTRFQALVGAAKDVLILETKTPATKQLAGAALSRRDAWLARHANEAVVVWDGHDDAVGRTVRSLRDHLGEEQVWVVEP